MRMILHKPSKETRNIDGDSASGIDNLKLYRHLIDDCRNCEFVATKYRILNFDKFFRNHKMILKRRISSDRFDVYRDYNSLKKQFPVLFSDLNVFGCALDGIADTNIEDVMQELRDKTKLYQMFGGFRIYTVFCFFISINLFLFIISGDVNAFGTKVLFLLFQVAIIFVVFFMLYKKFNSDYQNQKTKTTILNSTPPKTKRFNKKT